MKERKWKGVKKLKKKRSLKPNYKFSTQITMKEKERKKKERSKETKEKEVSSQTINFAHK